MKRKIIVMVFIILLVGLLSFFSIKTFTGHVVKVGSEEEKQIKDDCECIEHERMKCNEGWDLDEDRVLCIREREECSNELVLDLEDNCKIIKEATNVLWGCSKYDCDGTIWEVE